METDCLNESEQFMRKLGMRPIAKAQDYAILELRGGTHLLLLQKDSIVLDTADFDLMVEDLEEPHSRLDELGLSPNPIRKGRIHNYFTVQDPCGQVITFNSSHVSDFPV